MKTAILSILTAGALTLAPFSAKPVEAADPHDILGAFLGIAILGALTSDLNDNNTVNRTTQRYTPYRSNGVRNGHNKHRRANRKVLPGECLRVIEGRNNNQIVFPARCLARNGLAESRLPDRCERQVNTRRGRIDVYNASCLADRGWSLPRIARR